MNSSAQPGFVPRRRISNVCRCLVGAGHAASQPGRPRPQVARVSARELGVEIII
jgi:hypothetical protein